MITCHYNENNHTKKGEFDVFSSKSNFMWVDCFNPSKYEIDELVKKTSISLNDIEQGLDENERPRINLANKYTQIIFAGPTKKDTNFKTASFSIIILKNKIITLRKINFEIFSTLNNMSEQKKFELFSNKQNDFLHFIMQEIIAEYFRITDNIEEIINNTDIELFHTVEDKKIIKSIFNLRKTLIYFHKSLIADWEVLAGIASEALPRIEKHQLIKFRLLHNDLTQLIDMVSTYREILSSSLEVYIMTVSNNLNHIMKKLTVYASYILVPSLIAGIYGMNFKYFPEIEWKYGYFFALLFMVLAVVGLHIHFKKKRWI